MHEMAIAQGILDVALRVAEEHQGTRIGRVTLRVGALQAVDPDSLSTGFRVVAQGTAAEEAFLEFIMVPATVRCVACEGVFQVEQYRITCPSCGGTPVVVEQGRELQIDSLEVE